LNDECEGKAASLLHSAALTAAAVKQTLEAGESAPAQDGQTFNIEETLLS